MKVLSPKSLRRGKAKSSSLPKNEDFIRYIYYILLSLQIKISPVIIKDMLVKADCFRERSSIFGSTCLKAALTMVQFQLSPVEGAKNVFMFGKQKEEDN